MTWLIDFTPKAANYNSTTATSTVYNSHSSASSESIQKISFPEMKCTYYKSEFLNSDKQLTKSVSAGEDIKLHLSQDALLKHFIFNNCQVNIHIYKNK